MLYSEAETKVSNRPKTGYGERTVTAYVPALIWLLSAVVCYYIAKTRGVKLSAIWGFVVVLLGPFAIPLIFLAKAEEST